MDRTPRGKTYITVGNSISLDDVGNFREFHVVVEANVAAAVAAFGVRAGPSEQDNHLWIDIAFVRELAGDAADAEWEAQFEGMLAYADSKGWIDEAANRVEAHIQPPG